MNLPPHHLQSDPRSPIRNIQYNADGSLFASAETEGWRIWETEELEQVAQTDTINGSVSIALPLMRSNIVLLVGGPPSPLYAPNKVRFYSLIENMPMATLEFDSAVLGMAARRDRLAVALKHKIVLFGLNLDSANNAISEEGHYVTKHNPRGLVVMATLSGSTLLAFPGRQSGHVALAKLPPLTDSPANDILPAAKSPPYPATSILMAHTTPLAALATNTNGSTVATASLKGTIIRVWCTQTSNLLKEVRRGTDPADIFSLALRPDGRALACASDKGTIHLWSFVDDNSRSSRPSSRSSDRSSTRSNRSEVDGMAVLKPFLPHYFSSTWSTGLFRLPPPEAQSARVLPFLDQLAEEKREKPISVEEDFITCCWVKCESSSTGNDDCNVRSKGRASQAEAKSSAHEYVLIATARSGGYFKLALTGKDSKHAQQKRAHTVTYGFGPEGQCELLQYKRFEQRDGW